MRKYGDSLCPHFSTYGPGHISPSTASEPLGAVGCWGAQQSLLSCIFDIVEYEIFGMPGRIHLGIVLDDNEYVVHARLRS